MRNIISKNYTFPTLLLKIILKIIFKLISAIKNLYFKNHTFSVILIIENTIIMVIFFYFLILINYIKRFDFLTRP